MIRMSRIALVAIAGVALAGCTATQFGHAEYGSYDSAEALAADSTDVVEVRVTGSREATLESAPFVGTDPESNPYYGTDDVTRPRPEQVSIDVTIFDAVVVESFAGDAATGVRIDISQVRDVAETVPLKVGETYVLFLRDVDPAYPVGIVGGPQGQFLVADDGSLRPAVESTRWSLTVRELRHLDEPPRQRTAAPSAPGHG